ncbi:protein lifeguard 1-like [Tropilaelaps mercedesae]|uniref:Protein lifeguard 1-like n=1 Tax=Tropilaelaps mercedesae TaxID=418985 RepID=A0A1V9XRB0_9ACAR|nr:protein lifeguard 1-like [Tropilaelaps mercedesae]
MVFVHSSILHKVYAGVGALIFMVFLAFDTQLLMDGKRYSISPEEYVFATIQLYVDIVQIFMFLLSLIGER